jgi:hypothetical protein
VASRALIGVGLLTALMVAACDPDAWRSAFDSWRPDPEFNRWASRVTQECHPRTIGKEPLDSRFRQETFFNLTSRLYSGRITVQQYANSLNSFYPGDNRAAIECIVARLPPPATPQGGM